MATKKCIFNTLCSYLNENQIEYRSVQHQAAYTSKESSQARCEDLSIDGKALLMKVDNRFCLFVLSAVKKCDSKKIKEYFNAKKLRFASSDELFQRTQLIE